MSKASDVAYGRQGGRLVDPGATAEEAIAAVAGMRSSAARTGSAWPAGGDPFTARLHPDQVARDAARTKARDRLYPNGIGTGQKADEARAHLATIRPTTAELAHAWAARARSAHARLAEDRHHEPEIPVEHAPSLDPVDRAAITRHPTMPTIEELAELARKAQP